MRGQRRALETMMPFSKEVASLGRPARPHSLAFCGSCQQQKHLREGRQPSTHHVMGSLPSFRCSRANCRVISYHSGRTSLPYLLVKILRCTLSLSSPCVAQCGVGRGQLCRACRAVTTQACGHHATHNKLAGSCNHTAVNRQRPPNRRSAWIARFCMTGKGYRQLW